MDWNELFDTEEKALKFVKLHEPRIYATWHTDKPSMYEEDIPAIKIRSGYWIFFMCHVSYKCYSCGYKERRITSKSPINEVFISYLCGDDKMKETIFDIIGKDEDIEKKVDKLIFDWNRDNYGIFSALRFRFVRDDNGHEFHTRCSNFYDENGKIYSSEDEQIE